MTIGAIPAIFRRRSDYLAHRHHDDEGGDADDHASTLGQTPFMRPDRLYTLSFDNFSGTTEMLGYVLQVNTSGVTEGGPQQVAPRLDVCRGGPPCRPSPAIPAEGFVGSRRRLQGRPRPKYSTLLKSPRRPRGHRGTYAGTERFVIKDSQPRRQLSGQPPRLHTTASIKNCDRFQSRCRRFAHPISFVRLSLKPA